MKRVLVTGAAGFLGSHTARHLAADGFEVIAHGRSEASLQSFKTDTFATWVCDLSDPAARVTFAKVGKVDAVVHCAGLTSTWGRRADFRKDNVTATENLLALVRGRDAPHVVHISSSTLYFQFRDQLGVREDSPLPRPVNGYAWSKGLAEDVVRAARDIPATILRPRGIYGKGDRAFLPRLIRTAQHGPLPSFRGGQSVFDPTHIDDVTSAVAAVLANPGKAAGKTYNVSGGEALRVRDLIERCAARAGVGVTWRKTPWPLAFSVIRAIEGFHAIFRPQVEPVVTAYAAGLLAFSQTMDISAIARDLGWRPAISFERGLQLTFDEAA